jgi:2-polyprenyl-3-methyl-5-hydroxy-6-metoxy-1,4-benzoquinol methylase
MEKPEFNEDLWEKLMDGSNFDEQFYLKENPDVARAVKRRQFRSGHQHYLKHGKREARRPRPFTAEESIEYLFNIIIKSSWPKKWPEAVPDWMICDATNEDDKTKRAEGILDYLYFNNDLKRFLDFGCGEGHAAQAALKRRGTTISIGYDIKKTGGLSWKAKPRVGRGIPYLVTNIKALDNYAPFDNVLIYDVVDHAEDPIGVLRAVSNLLAKDGQINLVCHPWTSRHGAHLYRRLNKAFLHLIFTREELKDKLDISLDFSQKVTDLKIYENWIQEAGLRIIDKNAQKTTIEDKFKIQVFQSHLNKYNNLECSFLEFKLGK